MIKGQLSAFEGKREKPFIFVIVLEHLLYISTHWDSPLFYFVLENLLDISVHWNACDCFK